MSKSADVEALDPQPFYCMLKSIRFGSLGNHKSLAAFHRWIELEPVKGAELIRVSDQPSSVFNIVLTTLWLPRSAPAFPSPSRFKAQCQ
jgi:hypothetical protein